jgi:hypothetical protein
MSHISNRRMKWSDTEQWQDYEDVETPQNLGRRRPLTTEWSDYISDSNEEHAEVLRSGVSPRVKLEQAYEKRTGGKVTSKGNVRKKGQGRKKAEPVAMVQQTPLPPNTIPTRFNLSTGQFDTITISALPPSTGVGPD